MYPTIEGLTNAEVKRRADRFKADFEKWQQGQDAATREPQGRPLPRPAPAPLGGADSLYQRTQAARKAMLTSAAFGDGEAVANLRVAKWFPDNDSAVGRVNHRQTDGEVSAAAGRFLASSFGVSPAALGVPQQSTVTLRAADVYAARNRPYGSGAR